MVKFLPEDLPGYRAERVLCQRCGEGIGFHREVHKRGSPFAAPVREKRTGCLAGRYSVAYAA